MSLKEVEARTVIHSTLVYDGEITITGKCFFGVFKGAGWAKIQSEQ